MAREARHDPGAPRPSRWFAVGRSQDPDSATAGREAASQALSEQSALARAIIDLGETFDLRVVAEGIERPDQLARLRELGCGLGQGYLFSTPQPAEALEHYIRRSARAFLVT